MGINLEWLILRASLQEFYLTVVECRSTKQGRRGEESGDLQKRALQCPLYKLLSKQFDIWKSLIKSH